MADAASEHTSTALLSALRGARDRTPELPAVRASTRGEVWATTTWRELYDLSLAAAAAAYQFSGRGPLVVVADGSAESIATLAGVIIAGVDALLLEAKSSHLKDSQSPVRSIGAPVIIGPVGGESTTGIPYWSYDQFRAPPNPDAVAGPRESEVLEVTSGSTGEPRMARHPVRNLLVGGQLYAQLFQITEDDVVLVAVPIVHSYGLAGLWAALLTGATLVTLPHFSVRSLVSALHERATVMLGTPLLYRLLTPVLKARGPAPRLRTALSAGGPMPADVSAITTALGTPVRQIYGTTEAGLIACVPQSVSDWPSGAAGLAAPGVMLRVDSEQEPGRLSVRTRMMFKGYWGSDQPALSKDGFHDTGDQVRIDPAGYLFFLGRKDAFINIGGRKVSAQRIERILLEHPGVREALVYGVERSDSEQEMHAALVLQPRTRVDEVLGFCRASLQGYEVPHQVHLLDRLPRNSMGKVDRHDLLATIAGRRTLPTSRLA
jgi:acyl-CoA synthetase (AMP-forming)/AMP-acid ligase II